MNSGRLHPASCRCLIFITQRGLVRVSQSQTLNKYDQNFQDELVHQGALLPVDTKQRPSKRIPLRAKPQKGPPSPEQSVEAVEGQRCSQPLETVGVQR